MYYAKRRVAFQLRVHDDTHCVKVIYLVEALVLVVHFAVNTVYGFYSALHLAFYAGFRHLTFYLDLDAVYKILIRAVFAVYIVSYLAVADGVKI